MGTVITNFPTIAPVSAATDYAALNSYGYFKKQYGVSLNSDAYHVISNYGNYNIKGFILTNPNDLKPYGGTQVNDVVVGICLLCNTPFVVNLVISTSDAPSGYYYYPEFSSGIISYNSNEYNGVIISSGSSDYNAATGVYTGIYNVDKFSTFGEGVVATGVHPISTEMYPITYEYTNSTVSGVSEAAVGDTVVVTAVPDTDYGITDPTTQISVTNNDAPVNFTWDAATNTITFTMPDPT